MESGADSYSRGMLPIELPKHGIRLRRMRPDDAAALAKSRSDPKSAQFASWEVPFSIDKATEVIASMNDVEIPPPGRWMNIAIADAATDVYLGDCGVHLSDNERSAELGYTLSPAARGRGIVTAAATAIIDWLFSDPQRARITADLHPDNIASARVVERLGFVYEGRSRKSYWVGDVVSDDAHYGLLRADWSAWNNRVRTRPTTVRLVEITDDNLSAVSALSTHKSQERFVSPMAGSFRDALIPELVDGAPLVPWYRAIEADGVIVGFMMVADTNATHRNPYLWRLLINRTHQGRDIGRMALDELIAERRRRGDTKLFTSWVPGHGSPEPFYRKAGFTPTGNEVDGEIEAVMTL
jgi:RimJ/RimL family protein N-acetyltransferase